MRVIPYCANVSDIKNHYCQRGGNIPIFSGTAIQRGYGLGHILSGIVRSAVPILKKTVLPAVLKTGKEVISDVITKRKGFKDALVHSGAKRVEEFLGNIGGTSRRKPQKRKHSSMTITKLKSSKRKQRRLPIF